MYNLLEEGSREGNRSQDVRGLAGIVCDELGEVLQRSELSLCDGFKDGYLL